jgi:hypothetical protein
VPFFHLVLEQRVCCQAKQSKAKQNKTKQTRKPTLFYLNYFPHLWLSRGCLGEMIIFSSKMASQKRGFFSSHFLPVSFGGRQNFGSMPTPTWSFGSSSCEKRKEEKRRNGRPFF